MITFPTTMPRRDLRWSEFKSLCVQKNIISAMFQYEQLTAPDRYVIWAYDNNELITTEVLINVQGDVDPTYTQQQANVDEVDFETNFKSLCNGPLSPKTSDGRPRFASEKPNVSRVTIYTHDWTDPTTWYTNSVYVANEVPTAVSGTYQLAHPNVIDTFHGKLTGEDFLKDASGNNYRVHVSASGSVKSEQDPHYGYGGDYVVDYANGVITPLTGSWPDPVTVTYHYATNSTFVVKPLPGKNLVIMMAECQFSTDVVINDSVSFQPMGKVEFWAPQLCPVPYPSGTLIPLGNPVRYKTMQDYYNEALRAYPSYPPISTGSWRGVTQPAMVLNWDYIAAQEIFSSTGMQINIALDHHTPFSGTFATTTFYCISQDN